MNPKPLPPNVLELIKTYSNAQQNIIKIISEKQARGNVTDYHRALLKNVDSELASLNKQAIAWTGKNIPLEYKKGVNKVIDDLTKQGVKDISGYASFAVLHKSAIEVIIQNTIDDLTAANMFVGRQVRDAIRQAGIETATKQLTTGITTVEAKKQLMNEFVDMGINGIKTLDGRYISLASYAETVARSTVREASNRGTLNQATALGYGLVKMSSHRTSCKLCMQYEGRVYSIDGMDKRFPPLRTAYRPPFANIHPNCRHTISVYVEELAEDLESDIQYSNRPFKEPTKIDKSLEKYNAEQEKKRKLNADRRQYENYKFTFGKDAPKSLAGFRRMKQSDSDKWKELQSEYRSIRMQK